MLFCHRNVLMRWHAFEPVNGTSTSGPFLASSSLPGARADPDARLDWREAASLIPRADHRIKRESVSEQLVARSLSPRFPTFLPAYMRNR